jgi:signal transduction histidine kinase
MGDVRRVALAARVFTVAALTPLAALAGPQYAWGAALVAVTAALAIVLSLSGRLSESGVAVLEGTAIATLAAFTYPDQANVIPYLVIPMLIGALDRGVRGLLTVAVTEFGLLLVLWALVVQEWDRQLAASGFTWLATAVGIGLIGSALRGASAQVDPNASYRSAVGLIRRLDALSGELSSGLDAVSIADQILADAVGASATRSAGVFVRSASGSMTPLRYSTGTHSGSMPWGEQLAAECWDRRSTLRRDQHVALPLVADDEMLAVLVLDTLPSAQSLAALELPSRMTRHGVQLQAALLFGRVRDTATSEERLRIAREVHDGVAQDVASLGYLVDTLAADTTDPDQLQQIDQLRDEVTRVVSELRHSIFDLRHDVVAGAGLGESLSAYAQQVGATSRMTVHVTLDDKGPKLASCVEHELLRIGQEAMANARKHSGAANLWLRCTVGATRAEIEVGDDGTTPHEAKPDSQGLKIMHERSRSIGADLVVEEPGPGRPGTRVLVTVDTSTSVTTGSREEARERHPGYR